MLRRDISQGEISILPLDPLCSCGCYIQRISSRLSVRAGAAAPLSDFATCCKIVLKRRMASLDSVRPRSMLPRVCRNLSCKLLSHPPAALTGLVAVGEQCQQFCNTRIFCVNKKTGTNGNERYFARFVLLFLQTF